MTLHTLITTFTKSLLWIKVYFFEVAVQFDHPVTHT